MGFGLHRFCGDVDQNLLCSICSCVLEEPVLTPCGHSFCLLCLETWLSNSGSYSCPECRGRVGSNEARPILAVKNLIGNLDIHCDNLSRGCTDVVKLDKLASHLETCGYVKVKCAGCGSDVNRCDLADHQISCSAIAAACNEAVGTRHTLHRERLKFHNRPEEVTALSYRVASLELQLKRMKRELQSSETKNKALERELKKAKEEVEEKRTELLDHQTSDFDPDYTYGYSAISVAKLSCLISRHLLKKPAYVNRDETFLSVKRCYDRYGRHDANSDVHMLIATAYASNWFTDNQKLQLHCWLQNMVRFNHYNTIR